MYVTDLVEKTITKIDWNSEEVTFFTKDKSYRFTAEGDCCSLTWIESFDGVEDILGDRIMSIDVLDIDSQDYGEKKFYGYRFNTINASAILDFRNNSNGYYGGYLEYRR